MDQRRAVVVTVSDGVTQGTRVDESGPALVEMLRDAGYTVDLRTVPDEQNEITGLLRDVAGDAVLVVTTGGTGFSPRDVTPEATRAVIERDAPGLAEAMRAAGRTSTPFADLSRGIAGIVGGTIVLNVPGSPKGAVESLSAILDVLGHALDHLNGGGGH